MMVVTIEREPTGYATLRFAAEPSAATAKALRDAGVVGSGCLWHGRTYAIPDCVLAAEVSADSVRIELARIVNRSQVKRSNGLVTIRCPNEGDAVRALELLRALGRNGPLQIQRVVTWRTS